MWRTTALWNVASKFRRIHSSEGRWVGTMTPKKQANDDAGEGRVAESEADPDPTVAFSRPPPLPPVLGPLVAFSLLDSWLKRDSNDD
ncbi:hypothetical protein ACH5RR_038400 [Cinchona calisaya]|uniref:Uncharacterized protein n=1 Tax=Cinchona calisaya TaxID=153742 RepID=A0ABD2Y0I7_9GENT